MQQYTYITVSPHTCADKVIDVPMMTHTCMGDTWEKTAVQGE